MSNYTRNTLTGDLAPINAELEKVQQSIADKLDRVPSVGQANQLNNTLDANSNRIINLPAPSSPNDAARLVDVAAQSGTSVLPPQSGQNNRYLKTDGTTPFWSNVTKAEVGLGNVDNTTDALKPISTSQQTALNLKVNLEGITTTSLISSTTTYSANTIIKTTGFTTSGDGGGWGWKQNGVTGQTVSQSPAQLGNALLNDGNGDVWALVHSGTINVLKLGADSSGIVDSHATFVAAESSLSTQGGRIYAPKGAYLLSETLFIDSNAITVYGDGGGPWVNTSWLIGDHLTGPVIHFRGGSPNMHDINIESSATRAAGIAGANNIGLLYEPIDSPSTLLADGTFKRIGIADQPDSGWIMSAGIRRSLIEQIYVKRCGGHAGAVTNGALTGRTNTGNVGIITVNNCSAEACGGHALTIGDPGESTRPFRVEVNNYEGSDCATDNAVNYTDDQLYIRGDNIRCVLSAWRGIQPSATFSGGITAGGTNIEIINQRFVDCTYAVTVNTFDTTTRGVNIDGLIVFGSVIGVDMPNAIILPAAGDANGVRVWAQTTVTGSNITNLVSGTGQGLEIYHNGEKQDISNQAFTGEVSSKTVITPSLNAFPAIAAGVLDVERSFIQVVGEGGVADTIDTINYNGGVPPDGMELTIIAGSSSQNITISNNTGNIRCGANRTLVSNADTAVLKYRLSTSTWSLLSFSNN